LVVVLGHHDAQQLGLHARSVTHRIPTMRRC
jgi:hypothetical protein